MNDLLKELIGWFVLVALCFVLYATWLTSPTVIKDRQTGECLYVERGDGFCSDLPALYKTRYRGEHFHE